MIELWAEILTKLPTARLVIMGVSAGAMQQKIINDFANLTINVARITLHSRVGLDAFRQILLKTDISLDTYPYNGGTTSCETLQLGLPIITLIGKSFVSRMGYALLKSIGLEQLAAKNNQEYVGAAVMLASNLAHLAELRSGMKKRLASSTLCDELGFTQSLEHAYRDMWQKYINNTSER